MQETKKSASKICLICHKAFPADRTVCPEDGGELVNMKQSDKLIGEVFANRYKILSVVGQGGMSTVYKAQHTYMDRVVAVKLLHPHLVSDPISVQRFQQEAKAAASLSHANIITVFDFGVTDEGLAFLVMDYLEGPSLGDLIDRTGPVPADEALDIFRQVLKGLCHAHRKGVVHRDLKPRNLVLAVDEDGSVQVKIVDFGIAKMIPQDGGESQHLTQTGEVFGSPIYMSPEQCSGQPLDSRSDIYSLGCVMFECLAGVPPFLGQNAVETMSMHVNDDTPWIRQLAPSINIPRELEEVVRSCLEKNPKKRFETANMVLEAIPGAQGPRVSQTGTVAMKLGDMLNAAPAIAQGKSKAAPRKTKRSKIRVSSKFLATVFGIAFLSLFSLVAYFPFETAVDQGSPLAKMCWQTELWLSDRMREREWSGVSVSILRHALEDANKLGKGKDINYEARIETMSRLADALVASGYVDEQEKVVADIVSLDQERWELLGKELLGEIEDSLGYIEKLKRTGEPLAKHAAEYNLNWSGSVQRIVETARRLDSIYAYSTEGVILEKAEKLLSYLYGPDYPGIADILEQRARCLKAQDRMKEIRKTSIYENVLKLRLAHNDRLKIKPLEDPAYVRALLQLGQWQRDRDDFTNSETNLKSALDAAKALKEKGKIKADQLAEYADSYSDLLEQKNSFQDQVEQQKNTEIVKHYREMARAEREEARKACSDKNK